MQLLQSLSTSDVAQALQLHPEQIRRYAREGIIPCYKIGKGFRFDPVEVDAWVREHRVGGAS